MVVGMVDQVNAGIETTAEEADGLCVRRPVGLRDVALVVTAPRSVFARVEDTGAYGWALVLLLGLVILIGYAKVQTGLIDAVVERQTLAAKAQVEKTLGNLVDRTRRREAMVEVEKDGEFNRLITRLMVIVVAPVYFLASFLLIASVLYAIVALTGRKPEYQTLMSICVYAAFLEVIGYAIGLAMMFYYRTTEVGTSLALLGTPGQPTVWAAVEPFRIWFWVLMALGLIVTRQLTRRMAIVSCSLLGLVAFGVRVGIEYAQLLL
ncbi:MAG: YIP1 family protein [Planctomycetes bacterium]|nr:YIP1 family protein [Planctomycetota bacterium]